MPVLNFICNRFTWHRGVAVSVIVTVFHGLQTVCLAATNQAPPDPRGSNNAPSLAQISPVNQFRGLLSMREEDRQTFLATKRTDQAEVLRRKIEEYKAMPLQERELRLRQLELCRWMLPLMRLNAEARAPGLQRIPPRDRSVVEERLAEWDRLSSAQQENVRKDRTVLSYFFRPEPAFVKRQMDLMTIMPPKLKAKMESELAQWRGRPIAEKEKMRIRLDQLLDLHQKEREKVLAGIGPSEDVALRATMSLFLRLTPEQRDNCVDGFARLANLSPQEREQFIFDTKRWQDMTAEQRNLWRLMILRVKAPPTQPPSPIDAMRPSVPPPVRQFVTNAPLE